MTPVTTEIALCFNNNKHHSTTSIIHQHEITPSNTSYTRNYTFITPQLSLATPPAVCPITFSSPPPPGDGHCSLRERCRDRDSRQPGCPDEEDGGRGWCATDGGCEKGGGQLDLGGPDEEDGGRGWCATDGGCEKGGGQCVQ